MLIAYFCRWLPSTLLGQADKFIFKLPSRERTSPPWWQSAVDQCILAYADLQIATGIGILTAAFSTMSTLSVYHLQVAIYLAWMSSNTHLTAVSLLQTEFRENKNKSTARRLRIAGMALLGVMLLVALVPTTGYNWLAIITRSRRRGHTYDSAFRETTLSSAGIPARCLWQRQYSGGLIPDVAWSFIILIFSYLWKGLLLFRPSQRFLTLSSRQKMQGPIQRRLDNIAATLAQDRRKPRRWPVLQYKLTLCLYLAVWALFELAQSFVMSLWICGAGLVWGSFQILEPRRTIPSQTLDSENSWTFGQILPVLLLLVPILSFFEGYASTSVPSPPVPRHSIANTLTIGQKAERSRKLNYDKSPVAEDSSSPKGDEESIPAHAALGHQIHPQAAAEISLPIHNKIQATSDEDEHPNKGSNYLRGLDSLPPWRCDQRIFESRFVINCFWGSQLGILSLTALFVVFYFELFVPLGVSKFAKLHATLQTDFGIWFIVACTILAWLGVAMLLLTGGALFSDLFKLNLNSVGEQEAPYAREIAWDCADRDSAGPGA